MSAFTIYHYNRCGKSRTALSILKEEGINPEVRQYMKEAPSPEEIKEVLKKLNIKAEDLIRKNEKVYKENYKGKDVSEEEWHKIISEHPRLMQRPIVIHKDKAVIARPPEKVKEVI